MKRAFRGLTSSSGMVMCAGDAIPLAPIAKSWTTFKSRKTRSQRGIARRAAVAGVRAPVIAREAPTAGGARQSVLSRRRGLGRGSLCETRGLPDHGGPMTIDLAEFRRRTRERWAAGDYPSMAGYIAEVGERLVERAGIGPGMR